MLDVLESLARDELSVSAANEAIRTNLASENGHRPVYDALCRWAWRAMVERRFDEDLRDWHRLFLDTSARIEAGAVESEKSKWGLELDGHSVSERLRALADLLRMSVEATEAISVADLARRAHVVELLKLMESFGDGHVSREEMKRTLNLKDANLSRLLTLLAMHGLVERQTLGRRAEFRLTFNGRRLLKDRVPKKAVLTVLRPHIVAPDRILVSHPFENNVEVNDPPFRAIQSLGYVVIKPGSNNQTVRPNELSSQRSSSRMDQKHKQEALSA